jgi:hypothetical protein
LTDKQRREYAIVHNKTSELAFYDFDNLADELNDLDLSDFDFDFNLPSAPIDWAQVEEISKKNYEKPESDRLRCPLCNGVDEKIRFKKV